MHCSVYRLSLTHIFFAVPSSICSECARCACFKDRFRRSDAFLDEPRLSFSRVRRGYCSRTNPIDRKTRVASRRGSPRYIRRCTPPMLSRQESQNFRNHEDMLPLATPTCQVSRECVELHGVADLLLPTTSSRSRILSRFFEYFSFDFAGVCSVISCSLDNIRIYGL